MSPTTTWSSPSKYSNGKHRKGNIRPPLHYKLIAFLLLALSWFFISQNSHEDTNVHSSELAASPRSIERGGSSSQDLPKPYYDMILLVPSVASWVERRSFLRKQFERSRKMTEASTKLIFVLSNSDEVKTELQFENQENNDILYTKCQDVDAAQPEEDSSTTCKLLRGLQHVHENFHFQYLARVGDDAYFRLDYFWNEIRPRLPAGPVWVGRFMWNNAVLEPHLQTLYGITVYPPYAGGMGYVFSKDVVRYLAEASKMFPLHTGYPEDAVVGLWLVGTQTVRYHMPEFHDRLGVGGNQRDCDNESVLIHYMTPEMWDAVDATGMVSCR